MAIASSAGILAANTQHRTFIAKQFAAQWPEWFAVRVRTTQEKRARGFLEEQRFDCVLPLHERRRRWSDRIKTSDEALFPGYVFCAFPRPKRHSVLRTPSVIGIVETDGEPLAIDESEIRNLQILEQTPAKTNPHPFVTKGQRVRIASGCMEGVEGLVVNSERQARLVVSVSILQRSVSLEIDSALVEAV